MLGTLAEAEDAVQETYARWYRLTDEERSAIANPQGWLTRVASRICLDVLGSARVRRETYVGEWLPEPVPTGFLGDGVSGDPLDRVALDDAVEERHTADGAGYVVVSEGRVTGVITFRVVADRMSDIWIVLSPEKLTAWT